MVFLYKISIWREKFLSRQAINVREDFPLCDKRNEKLLKIASYYFGKVFHGSWSNLSAMIPVWRNFDDPTINSKFNFKDVEVK